MKKFIVVTRTFFEKEYKDRVLELSKSILPIFERQKGLISIQVHLDHEQKHTMTYFEWEKKEDHEACMVSPDFAEWNKLWEELIKSGKVKWELNTYEVLF